MKQKRILDACCGGRMFWWDKQNDDTIYMDNRTAPKGAFSLISGMISHYLMGHENPFYKAICYRLYVMVYTVATVQVNLMGAFYVNSKWSVH